MAAAGQCYTCTGILVIATQNRSPPAGETSLTKRRRPVIQITQETRKKEGLENYNIVSFTAAANTLLSSMGVCQ